MNVYFSYYNERRENSFGDEWLYELREADFLFIRNYYYEFKIY